MMNPQYCEIQKNNCRFFIPLTRAVIMSMFSVIVLCAPAVGIELNKISVADASAGSETLIFIDARPVKMWQQGHIPGARSFSFGVTASF